MKQVIWAEMALPAGAELCFNVFYLLESLIEVITILKPFVSVPQLSVTYLNVRKFVLVNSAPTDCFVSLQVKSA